MVGFFLLCSFFISRTNSSMTSTEGGRSFLLAHPRSDNTLTCCSFGPCEHWLCNTDVTMYKTEQKCTKIIDEQKWSLSQRILSLLHDITQISAVQFVASQLLLLLTININMYSQSAPRACHCSRWRALDELRWGRETWTWSARAAGSARKSTLSERKSSLITSWIKYAPYWLPYTPTLMKWEF